ncbi:MAG TPA: flavohemoglobin expression-modulating QEGLA motif protein [Aestuariivirgaceae bacterium]|nr:flavohemoglobin expression-modulating QEGLA motif protein [Aestuariivirgaceae bacterium]
MSKAPVEKGPVKASDAALIGDVLAAIGAGKPVRRDLEGGGRLHIDRPLPFLCVSAAAESNDAANDIAAANASYLVTADPECAAALILAIGGAMTERFGGFFLLDIGEFERDRMLSRDAPYLPPFEITLTATGQPAAAAAREAFASATESVEAKFRSPQIERLRVPDDPAAGPSQPAGLAGGFACLTVRFAPIYRIPESEGIYPDLRERVVANMFDAGLQAVAAALKVMDIFDLPSHWALGRKAVVDAVKRADRRIDDVASSFDLLLAVTPINSDAAWREFQSGGFRQAPKLFYRPLSVHVADQKRKLFSIAFDHFEDPVLSGLYREKQQELDLQLSMLAARETPRFVEIGRALYGSVAPALLEAAMDILARTADRIDSCNGGESGGRADCHVIEHAAGEMIANYREASPGFAAVVELRDDLPPGLMVAGARLLISRGTNMSRHRLTALLSHEIGVHLLTYFNGSAQGLRLFRSGLAGYEGVQEGLGVLAEYLVGGMTVGRLRLIAARVVACAAMLEGACFAEIFHTLVRDHSFTAIGAFNLTLRLYRGGGLAKDAIYLRGLLQVLDHLKGGGALDPFWMGKIAGSHFAIMEELSTRGLLRAPAVMPAFLSHPGARSRLEEARTGLSPVDMIAS